MKRVTLIIPDGYDDVLTATCAGRTGTVLNVNVHAYDLTEKSEYTFDVQNCIQNADSAAETD